MIPEFWTTRSEAYLAAILGETVELPEPQSRMELYLAKVAGVDVEVPEPQTRSELFLAAILGESVELPVPRSRVEFYLAKVAGMDVEIPEPLTRIDEYLAEWAENGSGWSWETVTGVSPLALASAAAHAVKSLIQTGKCVTSGGDIYCNNGRLAAVDDELPVGYKRITGIRFDGDFYYDTGESLTGDDDVTMTLANTSTTGQNVFGSYNGTASGAKNFSLFIFGGGSTSNSYFRYGEQLLRPRFGSNERTITFGKSGTDGFATDVTATPESFTTPANAYIGMLPNSTSPAFTGSIIGNIPIGTRLKYIPVEQESDGVIGYYERVNGNFIAPTGSGTPVSLGYDHSHETVLSVVGTPEVITLGEQTATAVDLFATDDAADEQDIISGVVTRRVEVTITGGVITISPLATPVTEHVTPQPLSTVEGDNTLSWTAEVSGTVKEVEYAYVAPSFVWKTASGAVVSVNDAIAGDVGALTVGINPVQTGSGDPSPSNVRPISGWTATEIFVSGVNIWNPDTSEAGYLNGSGQKSVQSANKEFLSDYIAVPSGATKLTISCDGLASGEQAWFGVGYYKADKTWIKRWASTSTKASVTINLEADASYIRIMARSFSHGVAALFAAWGEDIPYAQYAGGSVTPLTIPTPPGTVYGGTLDVLTGVLTVDRILRAFNGDVGETWAVNSSGGIWAFNTPNLNENKVTQTPMCNRFNAVSPKSYGSLSNGQLALTTSPHNYINIKTDVCSTVDEWRQWLSDNPLQIVLMLATPQTIQLTPAQVSTLLGTNVIWASGNGEISVTYRAEVSE